MPKKKAVLSSRLKKRAVIVAVHGGIRLPIMAKKLSVSLKTMRRWKRNFQGQIQKGELPAKKAQVHIKLLQALYRKARIQAKIVKLKTTLREAN